MILEDGKRIVCIKEGMTTYNFTISKLYTIQNSVIITESSRGHLAEDISHIENSNYCTIIDDDGTEAFLADIVVNEYFKDAE
jgi:hypothetical protein